MNFMTIISLITLMISGYACRRMCVTATKRYLDQIGPWIFVVSISICVGSLLAGIILHKFNALLVSKIAFVLVTAAMMGVFARFIETTPPNEIILIQDPIFGDTDPVSGIKKYALQKSGKLRIRPPWTVKPAGATGIKLQKQLTTPKDVEFEPKKGPATLQAKMSIAWERDPDQYIEYAMQKVTEDARIDYVNEALERNALSIGGALAKSTYEGEVILSDTNAFADVILTQLQPIAEGLKVKAKKIIFSGMDYDKEYKKVLNDIALANRLVAVALELAGRTEFPDLETRRVWLEEAKLATGIGDVKKEIFDVRGIGHLSPEDAAKVAAEMFARGRSRGAKS